MGTLGTRVRSVALVAGLLAGPLAWLALEATHETFVIPPGLQGDLAKSAEQARERAAANVKNATLAYGLIGGVVGLILGASGGWVRRSPRAMGAAGLVGLVLGGATGAGVARVLAPIPERNLLLVSESLGVPMLLHGALGGAIGAAAGLAHGLGRAVGSRATLKAASGGAFGAILGSIVYLVVGSLAFPLAETPRLVSLSATTRFLSCLAIALPAALGACLELEGPAEVTPAADPLVAGQRHPTA